ncbi:MAG: adenosylhomocysteinase [Clostridia bacterium]|jgi:adenosylhomocysteinase|nr:adenosylhomocysteinase [Clostridia bacterium]MDN5323970.1 adenosylhomocysteinase [Clostridia bacterium]
MKSQIRNLQLAPQGSDKISWVKNHMPVLNLINEEFKINKPFKGLRVVICLHLEAKTGYLAQVIQEGGAKVAVVASNPLSTQDDVVAALVESGITAFAWYKATDEEYFNHLNAAAQFEPNLVIDDGGDLVALLHSKYPEILDNVLGGCEETTTGILRLRSLEKEGTLKIPMIAVNDAMSKYLFDNRYGTGQSVWDGIMRTTNLVVAGKTVVVIGYGWCGKGVALRAKGLGAKVIVCEIDPIKATEALMDGFQVMPMIEAAPQGDFFITVTGNKNVIREEHLKLIKDKALLANAGHFDIEISKPDLVKMAVERKIVKPNIEEYLFSDGRKVYLLAEGRLVNLAAGDGHPVEIMDMTFALQALSLEYLTKNKTLKNKVYKVSEHIDQKVAALRLASLGIKFDKLTPEQEEYLASWQL